MARKLFALFFFITNLTIFFPIISAATKHIVGGSVGWTSSMPPSKTFYQDWSNTQDYTVGDTLEFNFQTGAHTVVEVPKSSYEACSTKNEIRTIAVGPASVELKTAGVHYYICGIAGHCALNQKFYITVS